MCDGRNRSVVGVAEDEDCGWMTRSKFYTNLYEDKKCYNCPPTRVVAGIRIGNTHCIELEDGGHF